MVMKRIRLVLHVRENVKIQRLFSMTASHGKHLDGWGFWRGALKVSKSEGGSQDAEPKISNAQTRDMEINSLAMHTVDNGVT